MEKFIAQFGSTSITLAESRPRKACTRCGNKRVGEERGAGWVCDQCIEVEIARAIARAVGSGVTV